MSDRIVWKKKMTDDFTARGTTIRSWTSRDGQHNKLVVKRGDKHPRTTISFEVDGKQIPDGKRRNGRMRVGVIESTSHLTPRERIRLLDKKFGYNLGAERERYRLHARLNAEATAELNASRAAATKQKLSHNEKLLRSVDAAVRFTEAERPARRRGKSKKDRVSLD